MILGKRLVLHPITDDDLPTLYKWRNDMSFLSFCTVRRTMVDYETFVKELKTDFQRDRHSQMMIILRNADISIGTIFSYNFNPIDGNVFVTTYLEKIFRNKGYGVEALILFVKFLFSVYPLFKIYMDVYDYNTSSRNALRRAHLYEEGRFKKHRFWNGRRYDLIRFAIYRRDMKKYQKLINYILERR